MTPPNEPGFPGKRYRTRSAVAEIRKAARHDLVEFISVGHWKVQANEQLTAAVTERFDRLDVLVNNVGTYSPSAPLARTAWRCRWHSTSSPCSSSSRRSCPC